MLGLEVERLDRRLCWINLFIYFYLAKVTVLSVNNTNFKSTIDFIDNYLFSSDEKFEEAII